MTTSIRPGQAVARGLLGAIIAMAAVRGVLLDTGLGNLLEALAGLVVGAAVVGVCLAAARLLAWLVPRLPEGLPVALLAGLMALLVFDAFSAAEIARGLLDTDSWSWPIDWPNLLTVPILGLLAVTAGLVAGCVMLARQYRLTSGRAWVAATAAGVVLSVAIVAGLAGSGDDPYPTDFSTLNAAATRVEALPDPAAPGRYVVERWSYGAGENPRRPEFGDERDLDSRTVDLTRVLPEWKKFRKSMRERYWGFSAEAAPLNGLVWSPEGDGPFPLVLVVHGNHGMEDYSDAGYAYLGELLASRGYIVVSVDQNYINGSWSGDFRGKEMAARAWLLLEHLALWRDWNGEQGHRFRGRADMQRVALIGHSRGGEAVSIAHAFNALPHFPDDATVAFDYGFDIRALVAIAQVDQRYHRRVHLEDVDFLTLHGSYDSDEPAYHGMRQYHRIAFDPGSRHFKAGIYIHGANHGQFNAGWGRHDYSPPGSWLLNTAPIIPGEDQRAIAKAWISAFLDASLREDRRYLGLMREPRTGRDWLPDHPYVQQYTDASFRALADFEEDLDVTVGSADGVAITTQDLAVWREEDLVHRDERLQGTRVAVVGWRAGSAPRYGLAVPGSFFDGAGTAQVLTLSISGSTELPPDEDGDEDREPAAPAFDVDLLLRDDRIVTVPSSAIAALAPPFRVQYLKNEADNEDAYNDEWEPVLQTVDIDLDTWLPAGVTADAIREVALEFDAADAGVVILDAIGFRRQPETL